ncbi:MAG: hypothetical protein H6672_16485 [Anaerolineaceae bacterium]|nr:hypothetical protein [Anaerolineaceae bacterium]
MAYILQVGFEIPIDKISDLELGASLERVLGFLRTTLPNEDGFLTSRAMRAVEATHRVHVIVETTWENWEAIQKHRQAGMAEDKVLREFGTHISQNHLVVRTYQEID